MPDPATNAAARPTRPTRTVLAGAVVLTGPDWTPRPADLLVEDGHLRAVEAPGALDHVDAARVDLRDRLVLPGLVNAHTHSHPLVARGAARDWTLERSLLNGRWMSAARSTELTELCATLAAAEMLASGATAAFDLLAQAGGPDLDGLHAAVDGYARVGLRVRLAPMVADRAVHDAVPAIGSCCAPPPAGPSTAAVVDACTRFVTGFPHGHGVEPALAPTIPSHCSTELLRSLHRLAVEHDLPVHLHLAESKPQAISSAEAFGRSITAHLAGHGVLDERLTAAHAIWVDDDDMARLADAGATVVTVPGSNLRLGSGIAPTRALLDAGVRLAIGTDGANSADALDVLDAARLTALLARVTVDPADRWLSVAEVLDASTVGGAAACGWTDTGTIAPGRRADLTVLDLGGSAFCPPNDLANQVLTAARAADVTDVVVGGAFRLRDRRVVGVDVARARDRFRELVEPFLAATAEARRLADADAAASAGALAELRARPWSVSRLLGPADEP